MRDGSRYFIARAKERSASGAQRLQKSACKALRRRRRRRGKSGPSEFRISAGIPDLVMANEQEREKKCCPGCTSPCDRANHECNHRREFACSRFSSRFSSSLHLLVHRQKSWKGSGHWRVIRPVEMFSGQYRFNIAWILE